MEILAQQAREEQNIIVYENQVNSNKLGLKQLLRLPIDEAFDIERPAANALQPSVQEANLAGIYNYALDHRSDIKSGDLKIQSAEMGVKFKSQPFAFCYSRGNLNSLFSSLGKRITGYQTVNTPVTVIFNGQSTTLTTVNQIPVVEKALILIN